jgi:hypothetical protein
MTVMGVKVISSDEAIDFERAVNKFLAKKENLIFHEKTVFGITRIEYSNDPYFGSAVVYSAIFYGELG